MRYLGLIVGIFALSACATSTYPTNVPIARAVAVFGSIGPIASQEGHQVQSHGSRLHIAFDADTEIQYVADPEFTGGPNILIGVIVDSGNVPESEVGARMHAASQKAYEWLNKASVVAPAPVMQPVGQPVGASLNVNIQVSAPAVMVVPTSCQKLLDCHAALAELFCQAAGAQCQFKVEISGMDALACSSALPGIQMTVQPLAMGMAGFSMPAACQ